MEQLATIGKIKILILDDKITAIVVAEKLNSMLERSNKMEWFFEDDFLF